MATIADNLTSTIRSTIEGAGGLFVGLKGNSAVFRDPRSERTASLYLFAVTKTNVSLALKNLREPQPADFEPLLPTEAVCRER